VHITKVKSVNLDKWPEGKVPMFQHMSTSLVNFYFEKNLPKTFRKPGPNASNSEVTDFMTNKYDHKKWADSDNWSNHPAWLYENKPAKFEKYVKYYVEQHGLVRDETPAKKEEKKMKAPPAPAKKITPPAPSNDINLLDFDAAPKTAAGDEDGFGGFTSSSSQPTQTTNQQQTINIQNLYQMYNANPHSANDKYSALDNMGQPPQFGANM